MSELVKLFRAIIGSVHTKLCCARVVWGYSFLCTTFVAGFRDSWKSLYSFLVIYTYPWFPLGFEQLWEIISRQGVLYCTSSAINATHRFLHNILFFLWDNMTSCRVPATKYGLRFSGTVLNVSFVEIWEEVFVFKARLQLSMWRSKNL